MYTAIANARMRRHVTQYKHKVQPLGWTNNPVSVVHVTHVTETGLFSLLCPEPDNSFVNIFKISFFYVYSTSLNVVIMHERITFQDINMDSSQQIMQLLELPRFG